MKIVSIKPDPNFDGKIVPNQFTIYSDTDSLFAPLEPIIHHRYGPLKHMSDETIIAHAKEVINDVQGFIIKTYDKYGEKYHNVTSHRWDIKQELIARRAFWAGTLNKKTKMFEGIKKRYCQWIVDKEGNPKNEMDVKGLDTVRSSFPKLFRTFMKEVLNDILHDVGKDVLNKKVQEFKKVVKTANILDIMSPSSVKEISKYTTGQIGVRLTGTPVHVKAALNYNDLLDMNGIIDIPKIQDGDKILWGYVKQNKYNYDTMAITGFNDAQIVTDFMNDHIDRDGIFEKTLKSKLDNFWLAMQWGTVNLNTLMSRFFTFS